MTTAGWRVLLGVGLAAGVLYLVRLGAAPFVDPPEGLHAEIAREMLAGGDWVTPRFNGVRYFDKPPLLYWLLATGFWLVGVSEWAARIWSALAAVGTAVLTAWIGWRLHSERAGLIAGLIVAANLESFLFGRMVKPDALFVFLILAAFAAFLAAYRGAGRWALLLAYGSLGLTLLAKDLLGAVGPVVAIALFFFLTRERQIRAQWLPWIGVAIFLVIALPWYLVVEWRNGGFLWYTVVDNHLLNFARQRIYPDEDVPLTALEFLVVTGIGFFPWSLAVPSALVRVFRPPWERVEDRGWLLLGLWSLLVLTFFTLSPFKLPHYGLPAFPALALLVGKLWDDALEGERRSPSPRVLLIPPLVALGALAVFSTLAWRGALWLPAGSLSLADVLSRNLDAQGQGVPFPTFNELRPLLGTLALIFCGGSVALAVAVWRGWPRFGLGVLLAVMAAFLPLTVEGLTLFGRSRSVKPMAEVLTMRAGPRDLVVYEGALENSGELLLSLRRPVKIVDGRQSNIAFGATFPDARDAFWGANEFRKRWTGPERLFLVSGVKPARSVVRELPSGRVHLLLQSGGRWLYSNRP